MWSWRGPDTRPSCLFYRSGHYHNTWPNSRKEKMRLRDNMWTHSFWWQEIHDMKMHWETRSCEKRQVGTPPNPCKACTGVHICDSGVHNWNELESWKQRHVIAREGTNLEVLQHLMPEDTLARDGEPAKGWHQGGQPRSLWHRAGVHRSWGYWPIRW